LIKILGLKHEKNYESVEDLNSLRYGHLMTMTDQDPHGCHFTGLIINFLHHNWPNLLRLPFLEQFITPIVTATKGIGESVECLRFYSLLEYEEWKSDTENWQHFRVKHYEGLWEV
jgi:DNA topoisomerase-2